VARLVERLAARQPLLVVLEDLHWADDISVRLLAFLGRRLSTWSVVVLVTAREEDLVEAPTLRRALEDLAHEGSIAIALDRLPRDETLALVRTLARATGDGPVLALLGERVWLASEGNPFMVVETVRALDEMVEQVTPVRTKDKEQPPTARRYLLIYTNENELEYEESYQGEGGETDLELPKALKATQTILKDSIVVFCPNRRSGHMAGTSCCLAKISAKTSAADCPRCNRS
jgi:hypothetical protein